MEYFLGCASPEGFRSSFPDTMGEAGIYAYILKGGPGTGKSTLMKKIAAAFPDEDAELYRCSSDMRSLDAVLLPRRGVVVADGTAPHVMEPQYPAVSGEIINLGALWDKEKITAHKDALLHCFEENAAYHACARRFICAYSALVADIAVLASDDMQKGKAAAFAKRFAVGRFGKSGSGSGKIRFRQLSAITATGYETLVPEGWKIFAIRDDCFAVADFLLRELAENAAQSGFDVCVSTMRLQGQSLFEHILIPEKKLAVMSAGRFNGLELADSEEINSLRFYSRRTLSEKKRKLGFCRRAAKELRDEAALSIASALEIHDVLERYYIPAMDFTALDALTGELTRRIS